MIEIDVQGLKDIEKRLTQLEKKVSKKLVRTAVRNAAKIMYDQIKSNIRGLDTKTQGDTQLRQRMLRALVVRAWKKQRRGLYGVGVRFLSEKEDLRRKKRVGVGGFVGYRLGSASSLRTKKELKTVGGRYYIPFALEYGHAFPGRGGGKGAPKDVPAKPFIRPAYDSKKNKAIQEVTRTVLEGIKEYGG